MAGGGWGPGVSVDARGRGGRGSGARQAGRPAQRMRTCTRLPTTPTHPPPTTPPCSASGRGARRRGRCLGGGAGRSSCAPAPWWRLGWQRRLHVTPGGGRPPAATSRSSPGAWVCACVGGWGGARAVGRAEVRVQQGSSEHEGLPTIPPHPPHPPTHRYSEYAALALPPSDMHTHTAHTHTHIPPPHTHHTPPPPHPHPQVQRVRRAGAAL